MESQVSRPREMILRGSFEATPELDSSTSSPDSRNDLFRFSEFDLTSQTWEAADFDLFNSSEDYERPLAGQATRANSIDSKGSPTTPNSKVRRRAQNRASQRAFRERKEKHVKGLETQLEALNERHQDLLVSYTKQADNIVRLSSHIAQLQAQIKTFKVSHEQKPLTGGNGPALLPATFDAFVFPGTPGVMLYDGDEVNFDENEPDDPIAKPGPDDSLPLFEDLLALP